MDTAQLGRFSVQLPALTGVSDKQIAYVARCRSERIAGAADLVINRPQFVASPVATQEAFVAALVVIVSEQTSASYWIDSSATLARELAVKASKIALSK